MAVLSESLVLRGVAVRLGGLVVGLRLGSQSNAKRATAMDNPTRHLAGFAPTEPQGVVCPDDVDYHIAGITPGAGRSRRWSRKGGKSPQRPRACALPAGQPPRARPTWEREEC
jgi:hypothetical protein